MTNSDAQHRFSSCFRWVNCYFWQLGDKSYITQKTLPLVASDRTMVDLESPFACRSRKLDGASNWPEDTDQNGYKANFSREG